MIQSGGVLTKSRLWTALDWNGIPQPGITQAIRWGAYDGLYRSHMWIATLVNKIANATARLPLKVYERESDGRNEAVGHRYRELLRSPSAVYDPFLFWLWVVSTLNIYGEAVLLKERDRLGQPKALHPWHPTKLDLKNGKWLLNLSSGAEVEIARRDFVHFRFFHPSDPNRGLSPLEPLRWTLENEEGARTANSALWRNGARPSVVLQHPGSLSTEAQTRLKANWEDIHRGAANFARTAVLEEGMEAKVISLDAEELQYIGVRQLNREECCAVYDVPPPVVHILDRATFSNITEQMRSMYRDTMAPKLKLIESTLEMELRDGRFGGNKDPDFGEEVYAEFLMDEVLRGSFEVRVAAMAQGIQTGQLTPAEARKLENRPFVEGSDQLFINSAVVPVDQAGQDQDDMTRSLDPVMRRHLLGLTRRMGELNGGTDDG